MALTFLSRWCSSLQFFRARICQKKKVAFAFDTLNRERVTVRQLIRFIDETLVNPRRCIQMVPAVLVPLPPLQRQYPSEKKLKQTQKRFYETSECSGPHDAQKTVLNTFHCRSLVVTMRVRDVTLRVNKPN